MAKQLHLRKSVRHAIIEHALGGQLLSTWWADSWQQARTHVISGHGGWASAEFHGQIESDGVHVWFGRRYTGLPADVHDTEFESRVRAPDVVVPWSEVREVVRQGATPELQERYTEAYRAYVEHSSKPLPVPWIAHHEARKRGLTDDDWFHDDPRNIAHSDQGDRIHVELRQVRAEIITNGIERTEPQFEQPGLW